MTELRDKIAQTIWEHETGGVGHRGAADAILQLLRDSIQLEWRPYNVLGCDGYRAGDYEYVEGLWWRHPMIPGLQRSSEPQGAALEHYRNTILSELGG